MAVVEALLLQLVDVGLPTKESFITHTVKQLLYARTATALTAPFCCTGREKRWYQEFYTTHSQRLQAREAAREAYPGLNRDEVRDWLMRLKGEMVNFYGVPPQRTYYMHELNFYLDKETREVKYHRMFPGPPVKSPGSKDAISVLFTLGADGEVGPGMIIFPRMVIPERLFESLRQVPGGKEWVLGSSANGWLTGDCVLEFVSDVFVPWLRKRAIRFPAALFSSECISGVSVAPAAAHFMAQGVQLIPVPREVAGVLSPVEWMMGYRLRWHWGRVVKEWSDGHDVKPLLEEHFAPFIISYLTNKAVPTKVTEKFAKFGICPFDPQAMFHFLLKYHAMSKAEKTRMLNERV
ncbi:hypothetical protein GWK47_023446 [Chionoecetes opilio]|uniref:DDE-1 domain-containing protein n=1 Tax=Chionoecetes opilio TaxID=41210 RepID=A0A8J4XMI2_CHIOP|nr:hypothetical protein GWK47_023446 [Chionoecetes opilio]